MSEAMKPCVSQAARNAAADAIKGARPIMAEEVRAGRMDEYEGVQAFARFEAEILSRPSASDSTGAGEALRPPSGRSPEYARRLLKGWLEWHDRATDDNDYLSGKGWDDAEALASSTMGALAALSQPSPDAEEDDRSWLGRSIDRIDAMFDAADEGAGKLVAWMYRADLGGDAYFSEKRNDLLAANAPPDGEWIETPLYAAPPPPDDGAVKLLEAILAEARMATDVIRLNRDGEGRGRIKVATSMHRIERLAREALALSQGEAGK